MSRKRRPDPKPPIRPTAPHFGGSYVRQPDGTVIPASVASNPLVTADQNVEEA